MSSGLRRSRNETGPGPQVETTAAPQLPELGEMVGYKLRRAQLLVFHQFIEHFAPLRLRPAEFAVLAVLERSPGRKQTEIAAQLGIKRANFVSLMDELEARGLAERRKAERDKRSHSLHLTAEGHRMVRKMTALWLRHEERLISRLGGPKERDRLIALLDRILLADSEQPLGQPPPPSRT